MEATRIITTNDGMVYLLAFEHNKLPKLNSSLKQCTLITTQTISWVRSAGIAYLGFRELGLHEAAV